MDSGDGSPSALNLALLYEGLLTGIARPQASRQHISDGETFRKRTKVTLKEIEHVAVPAGYDGQDVSGSSKCWIIGLDDLAQERFGIRGRFSRGRGRRFVNPLPMGDKPFAIARALAVLLLPTLTANIDPIELAFFVGQERVIMLLIGKWLSTALATVGARPDVPFVHCNIAADYG